METTIITLAQLLALAPDALLALAQQLHAAVRALAGVCDGAQKRDDVGFSAAEAINSYWLAGEDTFDGDMIDLIESKRAVATAAIVGVDATGSGVDVVAWFAGLAAKFGVVD